MFSAADIACVGARRLNRRLCEKCLRHLHVRKLEMKNMMLLD